MKRLIQFLFFAFTTSIALSQDLSAQGTGFETGNLSGWLSSSGDVGTSTGIQNVTYGGGKTWTIKPYGTHMAQLYPGGATQFNAATTSLGLTTAENTAIRNYLTYQSQNGGSGNPTPTTASWIKRTITLQAGTTYSFAWNYLSTDYTPYNDGSMMTLTHSTNASIVPTLNNSQQRYALLGFTNPGTGNYATGSYGSTGWQLATFTVSETGTYVLGFATFNLGDTALSPLLFIDEIQGTTELNGQTFGPVAPNAGSTAPATPSTPPPPPGPPPLCCGGSANPFNADAVKNAQVISFVNRTTADSKVFIEQIGNQNTITVQQTGTKNNYVNYYGNGLSNNINITQHGNTTTEVNYVDLKVVGNFNTATLQQTSTAGAKAVFADISGNNNSLIITQKDSGSHYAEVVLGGGNKNVDITQQGSAGHMAKVNLSGLPTDLSLTQSGSTQNYYSITHNCTTAGGCAKITVNQGQ